MTPLNHTVALFPGQGSQFSGMGKMLFVDFAIAREVFEEASDAIRLDLKKLCFDGAESDLALTANTQPAILTHSIAAFRVAQAETGFQPKIAAGHSLGEYSALVAGGAISLTDAVKMVRFRGEAMQRAVPAGEGSMLALMGIEDAALEALCKEASTIADNERRRAGVSKPVAALVSPANYNSDAQTVVAGSLDAIEALQTLLKSNQAFARVKAIPLSVSAPFHCALMKNAQTEMTTLFQKMNAKTSMKPLAFPYIPNVTARSHQEPSAVIDLLSDQIVKTVLWKQSVRHLLDLGHEQAIEFGPGKVLQGLAKRIAHPTQKTLSVSSCSDTETLKTLGGKI